MIGTTLGHFRIVAKIGESASGEVYRAEDEALRRHVALEVLAPGLASDPDHKARFLAAARAAAAVTHPNLAAIHEVGESDGRVWVAMELVEGATLRTRLRGRPLPLLDVLKVGEQIAEGLAAAHEKNLAHGGLRPEKVMQLPGGQVKVVDLGLRAGEGTATGDIRTDVYDLGAILYEMATGQAPGPAGAATIPVSVAAPSADLDQAATAELERIVGVCLEPSPDDRYQGATQLAVDLGRLRRIAEALPGDGSIERTGTKPGRSPRRRRTWATGAAALATALGIAAWRWAGPLLTPAPPFKAGDRILIADFVNETADAELGFAIQEFWGPGDGTTLVSVPRDTTREVVGLDAAAAAGRCIKGECEGYLTGRVAGDPSRYRVEIALYRAGRAKPVIALSTEADGKHIGRALEKMTGDAGQILRRMPGLGEPSLDPSQECPMVWSGDANALKALRESKRAAPLSGAGQYGEALAHARRALELDPASPASHNAAAWCYFRMRRRSEARPQFKEGLRLVSEAARGQPGCRWNALTAEVWYLETTWDYDALAEKVGLGVQLFPKHAWLWALYAELTHRMLGDPAAALPYARKYHEVGGSPVGNWIDFSGSLLNAGALDELDRLLEDVRKALPAHPTWVPRLARVRIDEAYVRGDDYGAIIGMIERMVGQQELSEEGARGVRAYALACAGRLAEAEKWAREEKTGQVASDAMSGASTADGYDFLDWMEKRRTGNVRLLDAAARDKYLESDDGLNDLARVSVVLGTARSLGAALPIVEEEQKDNRNHLVRDAIRFGRGSVALIEGRTSEAVGLLDPLGRDYGPASFLQPQQVLGRAYEAAGRWADAARSYEDLLAERRFWVGRAVPGVVFVLDQYRLARVYERFENVERARYWYGRFLNDWRNADPGTPEVEDAKRRLGTLGGPLPAQASQPGPRVSLRYRPGMYRK
jgi:tetratricopeptide (TPR) repeat protein